MEEYFRLEIRRTSPHDSFVCFLKMIFMYISIGKPWSMWVSMIRTSTLLMEKPNLLYIYIYVYVTYPRDWLIPPLIYLWNPCWIYIYIRVYIYSTQKKDPFHLFKRAILKVSVSGEESKFPWFDRNHHYWLVKSPCLFLKTNSCWWKPMFVA